MKFQSERVSAPGECFHIIQLLDQENLQITPLTLTLTKSCINNKQNINKKENSKISLILTVN